LIFSFKTNFGLQYLVQLAPQFALRGPRCEQSEQWGGVGTLSQPLLVGIINVYFYTLYLVKILKKHFT